jgi:hypothetical protein
LQGIGSGDAFGMLLVQRARAGEDGQRLIKAFNGP